MDRTPADPRHDAAPQAARRTVLRSDELTCPSCVARLERALYALDGVQSADVHVATGRIEVRHDPDRVDAARLVEAVRAAGYRATPSAI